MGSRMLEYFFLPLGVFFCLFFGVLFFGFWGFFFNLVCSNLTITAVKSPKKFPCKMNSASTSPLWLVHTACPAFSLHAHKCNDTRTRTICSISSRGMATTQRKQQENTGLLGPMARASHLSPSAAAWKGYCFQSGRDTTAAVISLSQSEIDVGVCLLFIHPSNSQGDFWTSRTYCSFCRFQCTKSAAEVLFIIPRNSVFRSTVSIGRVTLTTGYP